MTLIPSSTLFCQFGMLAMAFFLTAGDVAFAFSTAPLRPLRSSSQQLHMGMFDFIGDAFKNEGYENRRVTASHILVDTEEEASVVQKSLEDAPRDNVSAAFSAAARDYSTCPSANSGGSLGTFEPGSMLPEFETVVFDEEQAPVGQVVGPVKTQYGYHLVLVEKRFLNQDRSEGSGAF